MYKIEEYDNRINQHLEAGDIHAALRLIDEIRTAADEAGRSRNNPDSSDQNKSDSVVLDAWLNYWEGRCRMKEGDWGGAMSSFMKAELMTAEGMELVPVKRAGECRKMLEEIMAFYNKDMYNQ